MIKGFSLSLFIYISIYLHIYISISLYLYISISLYLDLSLYICMYICICIYVYIYIYIYIYICMYNDSYRCLWTRHAEHQLQRRQTWAKLRGHNNNNIIIWVNDIIIIISQHKDSTTGRCRNQTWANITPNSSHDQMYKHDCCSTLVDSIALLAPKWRIVWLRGHIGRPHPQQSFS